MGFLARMFVKNEENLIKFNKIWGVFDKIAWVFCKTWGVFDKKWGEFANYEKEKEEHLNADFSDFADYSL